MYFIVEVQKNDNGTYGNLVYQAATRAEADSKYYSILASAAISEIPQHAAIMFTADGFYIMSKSYNHESEVSK